ncbi:MAG: hypothetical protein ACO3JL_02200 [Myxococcota bacterium]
MNTRILVLVMAFVGCTPAPETAPSDYEDLLRFVFAHFRDDDPAALREGIEKLGEFMTDPAFRESAEAGQYVNPLSEESVDALDDQDRSAAALEGVTVVTPSPHSPQTIAATITWEGFAEVIADSYDVYEREFDQPSACFADKSCSLLRAESYSESQWAGLVEMKTRYNIEFRWVETSLGDVWLHRFWLVEPAGDPGGVQMRNNYYVAAALPDAMGCARVHSNWFDLDFGALGLSEDFAIDTLLNNMKADAARVDQWITENPR